MVVLLLYSSMSLHGLMFDSLAKGRCPSLAGSVQERITANVSWMQDITERARGSVVG
jgi:hypothetical protein